MLLLIVLFSTSRVDAELFWIAPAKLAGELLPLIVLFEIVMMPD